MTRTECFERCFGQNRIPPDKSVTDLLIIFFAEFIGTTIMMLVGCFGCTLVTVDVSENRVLFPSSFYYDDRGQLKPNARIANIPFENEDRIDLFSNKTFDNDTLLNVSIATTKSIELTTILNGIRPKRENITSLNPVENSDALPFDNIALEVAKRANDNMSDPLTEIEEEALWRLSRLTHELLSMQKTRVKARADSYRNESMSDFQRRYVFEVSPIIGATFGLGVMIATQIFAHISLAHFNPAISLGAFVLCHIKLTYMIVYWLAQLLGSLVAAGLMYMLSSGKQYSKTWCLTKLIGITPVQGMFVELILSFILVLVYAAASDECHQHHQETWSVRYGLVTTGLVMAGTNFTMGGLNPVRTIGPPIVHANYDGNVWIYWVGSLCGSPLAAILYRVAFRDRYSEEPSWNLFWDRH